MCGPNTAGVGAGTASGWVGAGVGASGLWFDARTAKARASDATIVMGNSPVRLSDPDPLKASIALEYATFESVLS